MSVLLKIIQKKSYVCLGKGIKNSVLYLRELSVTRLPSYYMNLFLICTLIGSCCGEIWWEAYVSEGSVGLELFNVHYSLWDWEGEDASAEKRKIGWERKEKVRVVSRIFSYFHFSNRGTSLLQPFPRETCLNPALSRRVDAQAPVSWGCWVLISQE
jgi:hypothetical protein